MQIKPVNARTLVRPIPQEEVKVGMLVLPNGGMSGMQEAVAMYDFCLADATGITVLIKAGEKVIYPEGEGMGHVIDGITYCWVVITNIWGIVSEGEMPKIEIIDKGDSL